jgi:hypothetical protein
VADDYGFIEAVVSSMFSAPKARNAKAWAIGPGWSQQSNRALKARNHVKRVFG